MAQPIVTKSIVDILKNNKEDTAKMFYKIADKLATSKD